MPHLTHLLRLSRPSFDAEQVGRRMAALYRSWDGCQDLAAVALPLLRPLGIVDEPIGQACLAAVAAVTQWGGLPYHSVLHHAEVAINAAVLAELAAISGHPLPAQDHALLLTGALSHDYLYCACGVPFGAERVSANAVDAIASGCGVAQSTRDDLTSLILATAPCFRRALAGMDTDQPVPEPLRSLLASPRLVSLAALLSDADLLSSAGLSVQWQAVQHARLEREVGRTMTYGGDLAFLDDLVGPTFITAPGRCFTPNLRRIRAACAELAGKGAAT